MPLDLPAFRRLSCGIVILNPDRELLLCHVTGQDHWDLPKGGLDAGETPLEAALRETREETGLSLDAEADRLRDLGRLRYTSKKDLHLFAIRLPRFDLAQLHCASHFQERPTGRRLPEMDGYDWVDFDGVAARCTAKMAAVLTTGLNLDRLLGSLTEEESSATLA